MARIGPTARLALGAILLVALSFASGASSADEGASRRPRIELSTSAGRIELALRPDAAPRGVAAFLEAIGRDAPGGPLHDGRAFTYVLPGIELRTERRPGERGTEIPSEIDAGALGLDERRIADRAEAMNVLQRELLPFRKKTLGKASLSPRLEAWHRRWKVEHRADFLIGVSRREILEAQDWNFVSGLPSLPVRRGSLALVPLGASRSSLQISLHLVDLPERDGIWVVVGEAVCGLALADALSRRPLLRDPAREHRPRDPVVIERLTLAPAGSPSPAGSPEARCPGEAGPLPSERGDSS